MFSSYIWNLSHLGSATVFFSGFIMSSNADVLLTDLQDNEPAGFHPDLTVVRQALQNALDNQVRSK